ncbi:hypothetical protein ACHAWC_007018 [Mediolabrus comicus]
MLCKHHDADWAISKVLCLKCVGSHHKLFLPLYTHTTANYIQLQETISPGNGTDFPKPGDKLTMHYHGTLASNGSKFDASRDRGRPFQFTIGIGQVIKGWDEGVMQMSLGEKAMLRITSDYGYGARGAGGVIPPNADLNFEVELLAINGKTLMEEEMEMYVIVTDGRGEGS